MLNKIPADRYVNIGLVALDLSVVMGNTAATPSRFAQEPPAAASKQFSITEARFYSALILVAIAAALVTGIAAYLFSQSNSRANSVKIEDASGGTNGMDRELSQFLKDAEAAKHGHDIQPITSHLGMKEGHLRRIFNFPEYTLGLCRWTAEGGVRAVFPARGENQLGPGRAVTFEIDAGVYPVLVDEPSFFDHLGPNEFAGLTVIGRSLVDEPTTVKLLKVAANWSALQALSLDSVPVDRPVLVAINNLQNLRELKLSHVTDFDPKQLVQMPLLPRLEKIFLSGIDVSPLDRAFASGRFFNLRLISFENTDVSAEVLTALTQCSHLDSLYLDEKNMSDDKIQSITPIKSLGVLIIRGTHLTDKQIKKLVACRNLRQISFSSKDYPSSERASLSKLDPRIHLTKD